MLTDPIRDKNFDILPASQKLPEFIKLVEEANIAINEDVYPSLIHEGSSGSYWVFSHDKKILGIFKPKNEEPYGKLNPKWLKWLHRIFFPCCFGRSCIVPNKGYLSEAGAYLVDQALGLNVVPKTFITFLASPTFNYSKIDRTALNARRYLKSKFNLTSDIQWILNPKIGSFQVYVDGFSNAYSYLQRANSDPLPPKADDDLQFLLEKMIILDYVTRNTDRGDNWLIKIQKKVALLSSEEQETYEIELAAIDNGLSFPFKHPDSWRSYPFHWAYISHAKRPFSQKVRDMIIPKLSDTGFVESLVESLEELFSIDRGFDRKRFIGQMGVLRGQIYNLLKAFQDETMTPEKLIQLHPIYVYKHINGGSFKYQKFAHDKQPFFKNY